MANFAAYQSRGNLSAQEQHFTKPLGLSYDNPGERTLAREGANMAGVFIKGYENLKEQYDSGKVMEANNEYNRLMSEGTAELMQKKQEQALNIVDDYDKLHQKALDQVRKKFGAFINYGKAGQAFNIYTERDNNTRRNNMMKYQIAETEAYHETQFNNQLAECQNLAAQGGYSDSAIEAGMNRANGFIEARYAPYGKEMIAQQKRAVQGQMVAGALQLAINMGDYARMNALCDKYSKVIDPKTMVTVKGLTMKRNREEKELSFHQQMVNALGLRASNEDYKQYLIDNWEKLHPRTGNYQGSNAEAWKEAQWVSEKTGIPAEFVYRQWAHESAYFSSQLARENNNFGGLTQTEWNGDDNLQPDGNNYYREFKNFHEYAEAYVKDFINLYEGQENVRDLASFAHYLKENGYYGADERDYLAAMENVEMEYIGGGEETAPSGVEFENELQEALKYRDNQLHLVEAENRRLIKNASTDIKEMVLSGDISGIDNIPIKYAYNPDGSVNREVLVDIQTMVDTEKTRQQKAIEKAAKGQPSEKIDADMRAYIEQKIASGANENEITEWLVNHGVTDQKQIDKVKGWMNDYKSNSGVFKLPLSSIRQSIDDYQIAKGADKAALGNKIDRIAKYEYRQWLYENGGKVPEDIETVVPDIVERVKKSYTEMYISNDKYYPNEWIPYWEEVQASKADLIASGYYPSFTRSNETVPGADEVYELIRLDGSGKDLKTAAEILAMKGAAGNVKR